MKSFFEDGVNKKLDKFLSCHDLTQAVATQGGVRTLSNVESVPIKTKLPKTHAASLNHWTTQSLASLCWERGMQGERLRELKAFPITSLRCVELLESQPVAKMHTGAKILWSHQRSVTHPQIQLSWKEDVFIIQPKVKTSLTSWEGKLIYDHLTGSFSEWQHPLLVSEVTILCFYLHPVDEKVQTARCNLGRARRMFSGGGSIGCT